MDLIGPLDKRYCNIFMILSIFAFISALFTVLYVVVLIATGSKFKNELIGFLLFNIPLYLLGYIQNRLFYNMCLR